MNRSAAGLLIDQMARERVPQLDLGGVATQEEFEARKEEFLKACRNYRREIQAFANSIRDALTPEERARLIELGNIPPDDAPG